MVSLSQLQEKYVQEPYDVIADVYTEKHFDEQIFNPLLEKFIQLLSQTGTILDAGAGPGGETKKLLERGFTVRSIDISTAMLKKARTLVPNGNFEYMDIMHMTFESEYFDGIWSARTLIHIPSSYLQETLEGFRRVLRTGGIMCLTVLGGTTEGVEPEYYDPSGKTSVFFNYFKPGQLENIVQSTGLKVLETVTSFREGEKESHICVFVKK